MLKINFFFFVICFPFLSFSQKQNFQKYAVIIGVSDYQDNRLDLRYCDDDAYRFYAYLQSKKGGSVPEKNISILIDEFATKKNIIKMMHATFKKANKNDMLIFYFSGHGANGAFCPYNQNASNSSFLSHNEIKKVFKRYKTKYKICIADACHSGSIYSKNLKNKKTSKSNNDTNLVIMMSSQSDEVSAENPKLRQGTFSYYFLRGLKGKADLNKDKVITLEEIFAYVKANVLNFTKNRQTPFIQGKAPRNMPITYL